MPRRLRSRLQGRAANAEAEAATLRDRLRSGAGAGGAGGGAYGRDTDLEEGPSGAGLGELGGLTAKLPAPKLSNGDLSGVLGQDALAKLAAVGAGVGGKGSERDLAGKDWSNKGGGSGGGSGGGAGLMRRHGTSRRALAGMDGGGGGDKDGRSMRGRASGPTTVLFLPYILNPAYKVMGWPSLVIASFRNSRTRWLGIVWGCVFLVRLAWCVGALG